MPKIGSEPFLAQPEDNRWEIAQAIRQNDWDTLKGISTDYYLFNYGVQLRFEKNPDGSVSVYDLGKS
jgi:hypothetical protein